MSDDLRKAFEATRYRVFIDRTSHVLKTGAPCPDPVAEWIARRTACRCAWLITAYNPNAERSDVAQNQARDTLLRAWAARCASAWLEAVNEDPTGDWPDEPGVLVAGIEEGQVRATARRFGQAAIVCVSLRAPVALVWD